jgi:hypothetical protein
VDRAADEPLTVQAGPWSGVRLRRRLRSRLARAVERRHHELRSSARLNEDVFDALVLLAAGDTTPTAIRAGWQHVQTLQHDMAKARQTRLTRLGFTPNEAETLSSLHTRNFM